MNLLNKLTVKNLELNKKRSIVTVIGIILSVALITAVASMVVSFKESMIAYERKSSGNYHYTFSKASSDDLSIFENNRAIEQCSVSKEVGYAKIEGSKNEYKPYVYIMEMDQSALENTGLKLVEGRFPTNSDEIVIPRHLKTNGRVELKVGQTITLDVGTRVSDGEKLTQSNPYVTKEDENSIVLYGEGIEKENSEEKTEEIVNTTQKTYTVVGIIERPSIENYSAPGYTFITYLSDKKEDEEYTVYVRYTKKALKDQYKITANILNVDANLFEELCTNANLSTSELNEITEQLANAKFDVNSNQYLIALETMNASDGTMKAIYMLAIIVTAIIIFTSVFCIKNSFNILITEKIRQYGMLASVGATSKQIRKNVLYEAFILGCIGIPIGIVCGILASYILIKVTNVLLGSAFVMEGFLIFKVSIGAILVSILLSSLTIYLSAKRSAKMASKVSPINAIRNNEDIKIKAKKLKTPKIVSKMFGIGGTISYKNMKRNKKIYRTTVISIIMCVSVYVALSYFINTIFKMVKLEYGEYNYNIYYETFSGDENKNNEIINNILRIDGIKRKTISKTRYISADNVKSTEDRIKYEAILNEDAGSIMIVSLGEEEYARYLKELNLNYNDAKDKAILINNCVSDVIGENGDNKKVTYEMLKCKDGDKIIGKMLNEEEKKEIEVIKVTDKRPFGYENYYSMPIMVVSDEKIETLYKTNGIRCYLQVDNADKVQDEIEKINNEDSMYNLTNIDAQMSQINSLFILISIFAYGFIIVIALIGITNIFNTITTNMELRSREFATLKSVGMTSKEFYKMIFSESFFYCFKSLLIGLPIGIGISYLIYLAMTNMQIFKYALPIKGIVVSIAVVFILIFTLMVYSVNKAKNKNIIETIRNENI